MPLTAGTMAGPYRVESPIGAGAMGEVYRAFDTRLQRAVALKLLAAEVVENTAGRQRFEQEARTIAALNHPNLMAIYDVGERDGRPYLVTELLEGETLRQRLAAGALPVRKVADWGAQIAHGLAAAHSRGIVHRDLKPENLFVTRDEQVKILDFGLAKLNPLVSAAVADDAATIATLAGSATLPGMVLGTVGYMAPEQARGEAADARSDIFSLGAVLYEMASGKRAFTGGSGIEILGAIVRDDPPALAAEGRDLPPALTGVIGRCLEKQPARRFQSAQDLAFALELLAGGTSSSTIAPMTVLPAPHRSGAPWWAIAAAAIIAGGLVWYVTQRSAAPPLPPSYQQLTFQQGIVSGARFEPDGAGIVYSADWSASTASHMQLYERRQGSSQPRALGIEGRLTAISPRGQLAVIQNCKNELLVCVGTLATISLAGGTPRVREDDVSSAAWAPDGEHLAAARLVNGKAQLEYPLGHVLLHGQGWYSAPRFSPDGHWIGFLDHPRTNSDNGAVEIIPAAGGQPHVLASGFQSLHGLAWLADTKQIEVTASRTAGFPDAVFRISTAGTARVVARVPGQITLQDLTAQGKALLVKVEDRSELIMGASGSAKQSNLSWQGANFIGAITPDGKQVVFCECGATGGPEGTIFMRATDGSAPVELGHGIPMGLSPDGRYLAADVTSFSGVGRGHIELLPTGAGNPIALPRGGVYIYGFLASWLPLDNALVGTAQTAAGSAWRLYRQPVSGAPAVMISGPIVPIGPAPVTADGRFALGKSAADHHWYLYPVEGGTARSFTKLPANYLPLNFTSDGKRLVAADPSKLPYTTYAIDLATGKQTALVAITPPNNPGKLSIDGPILSANGRFYGYTLDRVVSALYQVSGLP